MAFVLVLGKTPLVALLSKSFSISLSIPLTKTLTKTLLKTPAVAC